MTTASKGFRGEFQQFLREKGIVKSPEELEILANEYGKKYQEMMEGVKDPPRESTATESQSNAREANTINTDAAVDRYQRVTKPMGEDLLELRGGKITQDTEAYKARADNETQQYLAITGGTLREAMGDGYASKDRTHEREIGYHSGRDDKLLGAHKEYMDMQRQQYNINFIKDLVGTAIMLGM